MSMIPKGGDTIWGGLDWSPEEGFSPSKEKESHDDADNSSDESSGILCKSESVHYGRIISFGKDVAEAPSSEIERIDFRVRL